MKQEQKYILIVGILLVIVIGSLIASLLVNPLPEPTTSTEGLKTFNSYDELKEYVKDNTELGSYFPGILERTTNLVAPSMAKGGVAMDSGSSGPASEYSQTNVQVEGVDESDIVKNDGEYIYSLSGNKVVITKAYPAETMKVVSTIYINGSTISDLFVNEDRLILIGNSYESVPYDGLTMKIASSIGIMPPIYQDSKTSLFVYNIENREEPKMEKNISLDGNFVSARMIEDFVYVISSKNVNYNNIDLPRYRINGVETSVPVDSIGYFDYLDSSYVFTSVSAININNEDFDTKVFLTGATMTVYVSENNIYLTGIKTIDREVYTEETIKEVFMPLLPNKEKEETEDIMASGLGTADKWNKVTKVIDDYSSSLQGDEKAEFDKKLLRAFEEFNQKIAKESEKTVVHKIGVDGEDIEYKGSGEAPGHVLNQFSLDEYKGNLRIATTTGNLWQGNSLNHIYVLDEDLKIIGKLEDLAHGEKIYSARFIGKRAYLVTFKKIDPFYVIDLSDPEQPAVLGYLKIPGYSDYLHPYDEDHVIGIGKEAVDASSDLINRRNLDFAWYQGVKIALFDVSDVSNPKEQAKLVIGDRGTDSSALYDHKAFLFDKKRGIIVLPINLFEIDRSKYRTCTEEELKDYRSYSYCLTPQTYGQQVWQGAYVLDINEENISVRGRVNHFPANEAKYGPASEEEIGATRIDGSGNVWKKIDDDRWVTEAEGYEYVLWGDDMIDQMPGGVKYYLQWYDDRYLIQRSLYMDNVLYTVSPGVIQASDMGNVKKVNSVELPYENSYYPGPLYLM